MYFEWDPAKAKSNLKKHGVSFELAVTIFFDPFHLSIEDTTASEERWVTIGMASNSSTLIVVHTYKIFKDKEEHIRIISAREATKRERHQYEERI